MPVVSTEGGARAAGAIPISQKILWRAREAFLLRKVLVNILTQTNYSINQNLKIDLYLQQIIIKEKL